ncbi:PP-loop family-domain-containing protein [Neohortaea acidophila]|uniref:tRNA(Ile)-lysidine synthetase n=1 Tax=Neohortaea acidophila TaxID=245834 RepID=A0A6A6Q778_9PEZI|nr:PP-loop family-domain-containing protein [Neohortaea acidophila]KAF2488240.1 PP-loop family-domain-containing protein [Neohortaea acidophila]
MALARLCHDAVRMETSPMKPLLSAIPDYPRSSTWFTAFIVDHKLRANSSDESKRVAAELAKLHIDAQILELDWAALDIDNPRSLTNLESIARRLRYRAIGKACASHGIGSLLVAHHARDQAETVLLRILTEYLGSGLGGMRSCAGIPECRGIYGVDQSGSGRLITTGGEAMVVEQGGVTIARPMLSLRKEELVAFCEESSVKWFEDPTNADPTLTMRNTVRSLQEKNTLPVALRADRILALADNINRRRVDVERTVDEIYSRTKITLDIRMGEATVRLPEEMQSHSSSVQATVLRRLLELVSPKDNVAVSQIAQTAEALFNERDAERSASTRSFQVAGVHIERSNGQLPRVTLRRATPSAAERETQQITLSFDSAGWSEWHLWDGRWWIRIQPPARLDSTASIRFLTKEDLHAVRRRLDKEDRRLLDKKLERAKGLQRFTLPAIICNEGSPQSADGKQVEVVALPSLGWR